MLVLLVGFMGSGKTSMLHKLSTSAADSSSRKMQTIDLDEKILRDFGQGEENLGAFIRKRGLPQFRAYETQALEEVLSHESDDSYVVALGGGCLGDGEENSSKNWEAIAQSANSSQLFIVWLATPFEECWRRIKGNSERPLVELGKEKLRELYEKRGPVYGRADVALTPDQQEEIKTFGDLEKCLKSSRKKVKKVKN